jgi:hypothetical protein
MALEITDAKTETSETNTLCHFKTSGFLREFSQCLKKKGHKLTGNKKGTKP